MRSLTLSFLAMLFAVACLAKSNADTLIVDSVISRSEQAYAHLKTYSDSGKVIQLFIGVNSPKSAVVFKTAYVNTGNINFEYYIPGNSNSLYTINRTDSIIKTWWGLTKRTDSPKNMSYALAGAAGVSATTSTIIPELLLPAEFKKRNIYHTLIKYALAGKELVNGKDCYKISATTRRGAMTIWVGKKDLLIRKITTENVVDPAKTEAEERKIAAKMVASGDSISKIHRSAMQKLAAIRKIDSLNGKTVQPFTVRSTFMFFPTVANKIKPELLKFRPDREVAL